MLLFLTCNWSHHARATRTSNPEIGISNDRIVEASDYQNSIIHIRTNAHKKRKPHPSTTCDVYR
jgi:hypothetical protein